MCNVLTVFIGRSTIIGAGSSSNFRNTISQGSNSMTGGNSSAPVLRSDVTLSELVILITEVRRHSIIKNLLHDLIPNFLKSKIHKALSNEAHDMKLQGILEEDSVSLPVQKCIEVLQQIPFFHVHRGQAIAIISWSQVRYIFHKTNLLTMFMFCSVSMLRARSSIT